LVAAFVVCTATLGLAWSQIGWHLAAGAVVLLVCFGMFAAGWIGGGDAKLFAATAPWLGLGSLGVFLFNTAIAGLFLAISMAMFRKLPVLPVYAHAPWLMRLHERKKDLPYAVAIAAGALLSFSQTPYFQLVIGG
ncbi:A24 family peptidase, partial [Hyphococcus sp.]|uniref:A24 family peptidase n=1 Tax=Hyphococcus sp. TaxID=2038636 RepID=UPI0035C77569